MKSVAIAKCQMRGSLNMMGDEKAVSRPREEVQDYCVILKVSMLACPTLYKYSKAPR